MANFTTTTKLGSMRQTATSIRVVVIVTGGGGGAAPPTSGQIWPRGSKA